MKWRIIAIAALLPALAWSAWWWVGAAAKEAAFTAWLADRRADGWMAEAASITTIGFPNRFDTRIERLALADPEVGWAWEAPFIDILMLSYAPTRAVLALPPAQDLSIPGARATLRSDRLMASANLAPDPALALRRVSLEGVGLRLDAPEGWAAAAQRMEAHIAEAPESAGPRNAYALALSAESVKLPAVWRERLDPAGAMAEALDRLTLDARAAFDRPLDRTAVEDRPPRLEALSLGTLEARWGALALTASGRVAADSEGYAAGEITVRATRWREMLRAAVAAGALDRDLAQAIEAGLGLLALLSGDADTIEAPLSFGGGLARIGPVPLGPAPRLYDPARP
jgi:hypothetical protein